MDPARPRLWREGARARVATNAAVVFAGGFLVAAARTGSVPSATRVGLACGVLAAPFFALREVVVAGVGVDGPVASAIAGGFAGYFGTLILAGPRWQIISQGAMVVGIGCGLADAVISTIDWKRKVFLVNRNDSSDMVSAAAPPAASTAVVNAAASAAVAAAAATGPTRPVHVAASSGITQSSDYSSIGAHPDNVVDIKADPLRAKDSTAPVCNHSSIESQPQTPDQDSKSSNANAALWVRWPVWFPVMKENDEEYQELIRRREATLLALEEEQARIATLLNAIESVKAGNRSPDAELAETGSMRAKGSMPRAPPPSARA